MADDEAGDNQQSPPWRNGLSYEIHTNREFEFMLEGRKPLAYFSDMIFDDEGVQEPDGEFERQVESGAFVKHEVRELWEPFTFNDRIVTGRWHRFYALKDEAWRIPAFLLLNRIRDKHPWNDALERLEGSLLGYTDQQTDEWLAKYYERSAGWACLTLYATVTSQVLDEVAELGNRAFPKSAEQASFFIANRTPARATLEKAGLLSASDDRRLVRFGVTKEFFFECLERTPSGDLILVSVRKGVTTRDLNDALRSDIQIIDPK